MCIVYIYSTPVKRSVWVFVCENLPRFIFAVHPFVDVDMPPGFPSIFSRAYHTHLSQHSSDFDPLTSSFASSPTPPSTLPQFHPLLVRPPDHPQQQVATGRGNGGNATGNASGSGSGANSNTAGLSFENITPSAEAAVQAMQQVLTNITTESGAGSAGGNATGTSASTTERARGLSLHSV